MATRKPVKKTAEKNVSDKGVPSAKREVKPAPISVPPANRPGGPTAKTCPLVLDGEMDAAEFSPKACITCDEFDCRFCEAAKGSGALRSRLFAGGEDGEDAEDGWGGDPDFDAVGLDESAEEDAAEDGEEEELF